MKNWRDEILKYFTEPVPALTVVVDPDELFCDVKILHALSEKSIEVVVYGDPVSFRFIYESRYRDALAKASLNLVVRVAGTSFEEIPFDILTKGQKIDFNLGKLFPKLSPNVLKWLAKEDLDAVSEAYERYTGTNSDSDTIEFVLKTVFNIFVDTIRTQVDLLKLLLSIHYSGQQIPKMLAAFLAEKWGQLPGFKELPLQKLLCSEQYFFQYIQKEWNNLISDLNQKPAISRESSGCVMQIEAKHPIADRNVRLLLDNLFAEGRLTPVSVDNYKLLPEWVSFGIDYNADKQMRVRLIDRIFRISEKLSAEMSYKDWVHTAIMFGENKEKALVLRNGQDNELNINLKQLQMQIDRMFSKWMASEYNNLSNLPYLPNPVMVHHIPHFLANKKQENKIALVVLDGMSFVQWQQIHEALKPSFEFEQNGVFAWLPTVTAVSRQAIFSGERPAYFSSSINTTSKEERQWQLFWENQGILKMYVDYTRIATYPASYQQHSVIKPNNKVKAIVVDLIDQLVHAAMQGNRGLFEEVKIWLETGFLTKMISSLADEGYQVYITSDHGNRECVGTGKISEGVIAHTRGERVRVYNSKMLRDQAASNFSGIPWDSPGLPLDMHVFLSPVDGAFVAAGENVVSHGGMALEEVIVPFIKVIAKERKVAISYE